MCQIKLSMYALFVVALSLPAYGDDTNQNWHRWRGPDGNGVAANATPPTTWSGDSDNLKWKTEIEGKGSSSPIVWGNKIFLLTAVETERKAEGASEAKPPEAQNQNQGRRRRGRSRPAPTNFNEFFVVCIDRTNGKQIWKTMVTEAVPHESGHRTNTFASASPVTDGEFIYASFNSFGVYCLNMKGEIQWRRQLGKMRTRAGFGEGTSPALYEDTLVINWDHEGQSFIEALDKSNGKTKWKKERNEPTTWATPSFAKHNGVVQVITNGTTRIRSYDLENGELIWECGGQSSNPIPTPMVIDDRVVCMTGYRGTSAIAIPLGSKGDITDSDEILWHRTDIGPYVPTGVVYDNAIYSTKSGGPILTAVDSKTGETIIEETRLQGIRTLYASMVAANNNVFVTGRSGKTVVLQHGASFKVLSTNDVGEPVDATPALVGNQIIIRGAQHLFCFENE